MSTKITLYISEIQHARPELRKKIFTGKWHQKLTGGTFQLWDEIGGSSGHKMLTYLDVFGIHFPLLLKIALVAYMWARGLSIWLCTGAHHGVVCTKLKHRRMQLRTGRATWSSVIVWRALNEQEREELLSVLLFSTKVRRSSWLTTTKVIAHASMRGCDETRPTRTPQLHPPIPRHNR